MLLIMQEVVSLGFLQLNECMLNELIAANSSPNCISPFSFADPRFRRTL